MGMALNDLRSEISSGGLTVAVVGLGWMGLPTACLFAEAGAKVIGADVDPRVVEMVSRGESHLPEPGLPPLLRKHVRGGRLRATTNVREAASQSNIILIVVPTSIDRQKKPDYGAVEEACREIGKGMQTGSLIIFESTCGPGVTEGVVKTALEKHSGLKAGVDFGLAYSPIRAMSGRVLQDIQSYPKVVAGLDERSLEAACAVLSTIVKGSLIKVRNVRTAEATKLFETIYRDVNIALANEFALFCEKAGIDYMEVMNAANTQPYSHLHVPGIGVGGHCLPCYPYLLVAEAKAFDVKLNIVKYARMTNEAMPSHTLRLVIDALRSCGKSVRGAKVTVLGIAYRANAKETRFSPAVELINLLKRRGARVTVFDPLFSLSEVSIIGCNTEPTLKGAIEKANCVVITVAHDEFKQLDARELAACMSKPSAIVDCAHVLDPALVEESGLIYRGVGRGVWTK
jgi:nucleotide sugar dehydrogenase